MKLLFIVNVDWFFLSHRSPIALEAKKNGWEIHVACGITDKVEQLEALGFIVHPLPLSRNSTVLFQELKSLLTIYQIVKHIRPEVIHLVTIKPVIYGGLVSRLLKIQTRVVSISGLGYVFLAEGLKASLFRTVISALYRIALKRKRTRVIFQNPSDRDLFVRLKIIDSSQAIMIRGSGVDLRDYHVLSEPQGVPVVMLVARLLFDKGVGEFVEAASILRKNNIDARMVLVGDTDVNPKSVLRSELDLWKSEGLVEHWGFSHQVSATIAQSNIVVLPSYREGLPKCLIEAAACGRAVITTDVPGCRDAITPGETGLLVPVKDSESLAKAIEQLIKDPVMRREMALKGRSLAEQEFNIESVIATHLKLYTEME